MMPPPPPPSTADMPSAALGDDYYEDDFEDDDEDMQLDDEDIPSTAAASGGVGGDHGSSSASSSSTEDDHFRNPNPTRIPVSAPPNGATEDLDTPEAKRQRTFPSLEDSRRLFQRLWTDEDEIVILQGFYEFTSQRRTTHHAHQHDTGPFYDQIRSKLQLDFTKNQLVEKVRRLKKKYRNVVVRMSSGRDFAFKSPHDRATFEISRKIWSGAALQQNDNENGNAKENNELAIKEQARRRRRQRRSTALVSVGVGADAVPIEVKSVPALAVTPVDAKPFPLMPTSPVDIKPIPTLLNYAAESRPQPVALLSTSTNAIEETVRICLAPVFKELLSCAMNGQLMLGVGGGSSTALGLFPAGLLGSSPLLNGVKDGASEGKWRKQQISELEVYSKRLELVQEQIKATLEELRSVE